MPKLLVPGDHTLSRQSLCCPFSQSASQFTMINNLRHSSYVSGAFQCGKLQLGSAGSEGEGGQFFQSGACMSFPVAAMTNGHKCHGLIQCKFMMSQCRQSEIHTGPPWAQIEALAELLLCRLHGRTFSRLFQLLEATCCLGFWPLLRILSQQWLVASFT